MQYTDLINKTRLQLALVILLGLFAYANSFTGDLQFDDYDYIIDNPHIGSIGAMYNPPDYDTLSYNLRKHMHSRFVVMLTFWANYAAGGADPLGFHVVNFLIHCANALLVYALVAVTLKRRDGPLSYAPLFVSLIFMAHPLQTNAVTYISQRFTSMAAMAYMGSLLLYIMARREGRSTKGYTLYALCLLSAMLGMRTKETVFTMPLIAALYDYMFLEGGHKQRLMALAPLIATMAIVPLGFIDTHTTGGSFIVEVTSASQTHNRLVYLSTQARVILTYIQLIFIPTGLSLIRDFPVSSTISEPRVIGALCLLAALFSAGGWLALKGRRDVTRIAGFGMIWFFITLMVESSFIPLTDVILEHRTYLPAVGIWLAVTVFICDIAERRRELARPLAAIGAALVLVLGGATLMRNAVWKTQISLLENSRRSNPGEVRVHGMLYDLYTKEGRADDAATELRLTAQNDPTIRRDIHQDGLSLYKSGDYEGAVKQYRMALVTPPRQVDGPIGDLTINTDIGNAYMAMGMMANAVEQYNVVLKLDPHNASANNNLANIYETKNDLKNAVRYYQAALSHTPNSTDIHYNLAMLYMRMNRKADAKLELEAALKTSPQDEQVKEELRKLK